MPKSPVHPLRIDPALKRRIDAARGGESLSAWLRTAAVQRIEAERGLGPEFGETLVQLTAQLRGLGTNLNQLAHAANEGRPVVLEKALAERIGAAINATRGVVNDVRNRMSE
jgi:predicted transcriptional regulator